ncbi:MAG: LysR family transcriptional regulator [Peptococcaceae bacterium]
MELQQIRYFYVVATYENMSKAAEKLHITQPSLSSSISRLEDELGVKLFDRVGRGIVLNEYGKVMMECAQTIQDKLENTRCYIEEMKKKTNNKIRIGVNRPFLLTEFMKDFLKEHEEYIIQQKLYPDKEKLVEVITKEQCHLAVAVVAPEEILKLRQSKLEIIPLSKEQIVCYVSENSQLALQQTVSIQELEKEQFVNIYYDDARKSKNYITKQYGISPVFVYDGDEGTVQDLLQWEKGVMMGFESGVQYYDMKGITTLPITDGAGNLLKMSLVLGYNKDKLSMENKCFIESLKNYFGYCSENED